MNKKWGYTVEGLNLEESGKPGGLAARWESLIARLSFPDLLELQKQEGEIHLLKPEGIGWAENIQMETEIGKDCRRCMS
jgi:hypothetical protein